MSTNTLPQELLADLDKATPADDPYTSTARLSLPFLEGQSLVVSFYPDTVSAAEARAVLTQLMTVPATVRAAASGLIWDEMHMIFDARKGDFETIQDMLTCEGTERGFDDLRAPQTAADTWPLMQFKEIFLDRSVDEGAINAIVVADVAWDMEHQIGLFFRNGDVLVAATDPSAGV